MSLRTQSRILDAIQNGRCDAPVTSLDGRDLVAAMQMAIADHKAASERCSLRLVDDHEAHLRDLKAMESRHRLHAVLHRLGVDAKALAEVLL